MDDLFSNDVKRREKAARKCRVFAEKVRIPKRYRPDWKQLLGNRDSNAWPSCRSRHAHGAHLGNVGLDPRVDFPMGPAAPVVLQGV